MPASAGLPAAEQGEALCSPPKSGSVDGGHEDERSGGGLMERVVSRANLMAALKRVWHPAQSLLRRPRLAEARRLTSTV